VLFRLKEADNEEDMGKENEYDIEGVDVTMADYVIACLINEEFQKLWREMNEKREKIETLRLEDVAIIAGKFSSNIPYLPPLWNVNPAAPGHKRLVNVSYYVEPSFLLYLNNHLPHTNSLIR
jgi:hypothetical protein